MKKTAVIGIGNPLRRDDAIGIILLGKLIERKDDLPKNIKLIDGGTGGMNLLHILSSFDAVLIVDAVDFKGSAGEVKLFKAEDVISEKTSVGFSTHESDFLKIIKMSEELGEAPDEIFIFGIQPKDTSYGQKLSPKIKNNIESLTHRLVKNITSIQ